MTMTMTLRGHKGGGRLGAGPASGWKGTGGRAISLANPETGTGAENATRAGIRLLSNTTKLRSGSALGPFLL